MAFKFSTGFRDSVLDTSAVKTLLENTGTIKIYSGTAPATADAALGAAVLLVTITDNGLGGGLTFEAAAASGSLQKLSSQVWKGTIASSGTASFFRYVVAGDDGALSTTQVRVQGLVGLGGTDMNLSSVNLTATEEQTLDAFVIAFSTL